MTQSIVHTQDIEDLLNLFQTYAVECLKKQNEEIVESLRLRQISVNKIRPLEAAYKIGLKLDDDISAKSIQKQLLKQIDAAASFIRDFQIGVLGQTTSIFHLYEIEIQIGSNIQYSFRFESGKLFIQIPYGQVRFFSRTISYQEMKRLWSRGKHLSLLSPARRLWWLLNPIGDFRASLRTMLMLAVQKQILGIDQVLVKFGLAENSEHPSLDSQDKAKENQGFKESAIAFLKATVNDQKIGVNLELILKDQDESTVSELLGLFKKNLADPGQIEELIDAGTLTLQEVIHEEQSQVEIKMFGFVNVGNYHRIDVALNLSSGYLKKYVELVPRKTEVKALQFGFVNVYTIDDITVKPNFSGAIKLNFEAAALERALKELELLR